MKRYKFVDWNGIQRGIKNTDSLEEAIQTAIDYQCEVIDTQIYAENQIVYSVWDGWNLEWSFYSEPEAEIIMEKICL